MTEWRPLLIEVMGWHRDIDNHSYNECETEPCTWCERAAMALAAPAPVALTDEEIAAIAEGIDCEDWMRGHKHFRQQFARALLARTGETK